MRIRIALALGAALALAGCGSQGVLKPRAGKELPVAPYGRDDKLSSTELLGQSSQARPSRNVELHIKSEPRGDDPYDLPPQE